MKHPKPAIREPAPKYEAAGLLFAEFLNAIREEASHVPTGLVEVGRKGASRGN